MSTARIQPGLERIAALLKGLDFPWKSIHVAGTNGKGSICNYASSMLIGRSVKVGKFTSPHLVDRWDCISINGEPVAHTKFRVVENYFKKLDAKNNIGASPFEILTATAFTIFNDAKVKVGIVEVGMGGKLDSTNVLDNQAISVISKIARDHEGFLGNTLSEIATHKAGILRPQVPYIISPANEDNVQAVIQEYAQEMGAGPMLSTTSFNLGSALYGRSKWLRTTRNFLPFQEENLKLAVIATMQTLQDLDRNTKPTDLTKILLSNVKMLHRGRQEMVHVTPVFQQASARRNHVLVDGAHNPDAAVALDSFVQNNLRFGQSPSAERPERGWPVTWVLAMTQGKDARSYLATLLKPGDNVVTTTFGPVDGMPWVKPMDPKELLQLAKSVEPEITGVHVPVLGALRAVCTAKYLSNQIAAWSPIVVTGSLYLVGDFHRELRPRADKGWWTDSDAAAVADRDHFMRIQTEERERASAVLLSKAKGPSGTVADSTTTEESKLQEELDAIDHELEILNVEESRVKKEDTAARETEQSMSAADRLALEDERFAKLYATPEEIAAYVERAEKLKRSLAMHEVKLEARAKELAEKREERRLRRERIANKKERTREKKRLMKEQRGPHRYGYTTKPEREAQDGQGFRLRRTAVLSSQEDGFGRHSTRVDRASSTQDALSAHIEDGAKPRWTMGIRTPHVSSKGK